MKNWVLIMLVTMIALNTEANMIENRSDSNDHRWIDLGLPSGTLWATMNVGASSPEDYGDYFAWGETSPKEVYSLRAPTSGVKVPKTHRRSIALTANWELLTTRKH